MEKTYQTIEIMIVWTREVIIRAHEKQRGQMKTSEEQIDRRTKRIWEDQIQLDVKKLEIQNLRVIDFP